MTADDKVMARLRKLLELSRRGVGGEAENAERFMQRMLRQYGLTLADIDDQEAPRSWVEFSYKTEFEKQLLVNISAMVLNSPRIETATLGRTRSLYFKMTKFERAEAALHFDVLRGELAKHLDRALLAFLTVNNICPKKSSDESEAPMDRAELELLLQMVAGTKRVPVHKALPSLVKP